MGDGLRRGVASTPDSVVFKTVGACEIWADVYGGVIGASRPAILWLHPGALMFGSRGMIPPAQVARYVNAGYVVVAADYRLVPESTLPEILTDVHDAIAWVREEGSRRFGIDPRRLALVGHSAGGYLTLLAGCTVRPRPRALVAFYGYGDIVGPWYSKPSPFYCQQPLVSEQEAYAAVGTTPLAGSPNEDDAPDRRRFYLYCRQRGLWPQAVTGYDPARSLDLFLPYCPVRQVTADYPPTLLLHGDADTDVPYEQSVAMADALTSAGVPHQLVTIAGGPHVFDWQETVDSERAFAAVLAFLARYFELPPDVIQTS
jgi:acetyl esterase/lipase